MTTIGVSEREKKWERKTFEECIARRKGLNIEGIHQKEYKKTGTYPIVDQGNKMICGYTDDQTKVYKEDLPIIIFGDHTRVFKYINFPFAIGADGTKIIIPNHEVIEPEFFYFALLNLKIRNLGYSRHYKLVKEMSIPIAPLAVEQRIASELRERMVEGERLHTSIEKQLEVINALPQAILKKAFRGEL